MLDEQYVFKFPWPNVIIYGPFVSISMVGVFVLSMGMAEKAVEASHREVFDPDIILLGFMVAIVIVISGILYWRPLVLSIVEWFGVRRFRICQKGIMIARGGSRRERSVLHRWDDLVHVGPSKEMPVACGVRLEFRDNCIVTMSGWVLNWSEFGDFVRQVQESGDMSRLGKGLKRSD